MAGNGGMDPSAVRAAVNAVDCSISQGSNNDSGGKPSVSVGGKSGASQSESGFHSDGVPGYGSGKAKKAPQA